MIASNRCSLCFWVGDAFNHHYPSCRGASVAFAGPQSCKLSVDQGLEAARGQLRETADRIPVASTLHVLNAVSTQLMIGSERSKERGDAQTAERTAALAVAVEEQRSLLAIMIES